MVFSPGCPAICVFNKESVDTMFKKQKGAIKCPCCDLQVCHVCVYLSVCWGWNVGLDLPQPHHSLSANWGDMQITKGSMTEDKAMLSKIKQAQKKMQNAGKFKGIRLD
jgi:hypothetical protein